MDRLTKDQISKLPSTLSELYKMADLIISYFSKLRPCSLPCNKCCGFCCSKPPTITEIEAEYLSNQIKKGNYRTHADEYCRFFDKETNRCLVYTDRPLECRITETLDRGYLSHCSRYFKDVKFVETPELPTVEIRQLLYSHLYQICDEQNCFRSEHSVNYWIERFLKWK